MRSPVLLTLIALVGNGCLTTSTAKMPSCAMVSMDHSTCLAVSKYLEGDPLEIVEEPFIMLAPPVVEKIPVVVYYEPLKAMKVGYKPQ